MEIILYKTTHCSRCIELKRRLKALKIDYKEKNIDTDSVALADVLMLGQWVMPILTKDGELVDMDNLEEEFKT